MDARRWATAGLALLLTGAGPLAAQDAPRPLRGPGWIGISYGHDLRTGPRGIEAAVPVVTGVIPGSPAHRAGVQAGDTILGVDGNPGTPRTLAGLAGRLRPGEPVVLTLRREGREEEVRLVAAARPALPAVPPLPPHVAIHLDSVRRALLRNLDSVRVHVRARAGFRFVPGPEEPPRPLTPYRVGRDYLAGARVTELNPGLAEYFSVDEGVLVTDVLAGTPAEEAGLRAGDVIVSAGGRPPGSVEELRWILARSRGVVFLTVVRKGAPVELRLFR